jgi:ammonia channel protein AmtB
MLLFIYLAALIGGLLIYMLGSKNPKVEKIGLLLLASSILAGLIAIAPGAMAKLLH